MTQTEVWTIGRLLEWTTEHLRKKGSDSARLDAEVLLAHARKCQRIQLYTAFNEEPDEAVRAVFRELVLRRAEGTPVAYLVGHKEFYSIDFIVTPDCLIPRPETEHLVVAALDQAKRWKQKNSEAGQGRDSNKIVIADICTGSGCVAVTVAKHLPNATVIASDISSAAIGIAKQNSEKNLESGDKVSFFEGDLLEAIPAEMGPIDLLLSNPPYISQTEYDALPKGVRNFEPRQALLSGPTGLEITQRLFEQAVSRVAQGGSVMIETSPMLAPSLEEWIRSQDAWEFKNTVKDLQQHPRIVIAQRK